MSDIQWDEGSRKGKWMGKGIKGEGEGSNGVKNDADWTTKYTYTQNEGAG